MDEALAVSERRPRAVRGSPDVQSKRRGLHLCVGGRTGRYRVARHKRQRDAREQVCEVKIDVQWGEVLVCVPIDGNLVKGTQHYTTMNRGERKRKRKRVYTVLSKERSEGCECARACARACSCVGGSPCPPPLFLSLPLSLCETHVCSEEPNREFAQCGACLSP